MPAVARKLPFTCIFNGLMDGDEVMPSENMACLCVRQKTAKAAVVPNFSSPSHLWGPNVTLDPRHKAVQGPKPSHFKATPGRMPTSH